MRHEFDFYSFMGQNKIPGEQPSTKSNTRFYNFFFLQFCIVVYIVYSVDQLENEMGGGM